jgi:hypothetical protein
MKILTLFSVGLAVTSLSLRAETQRTIAAGATTTTTTTTTAATPPAGHPIAGYVAQDMKWIEAPPSLPNAQMVVLQGDPTKAGPYTIRVKFPAGYRVPLHFHDTDVNLTVISGLLYIGIGPTFDQSNMKEIGATSFAMLPAKMKHNEWCDVETIVQMHGIGPWTMHQADPNATVRAP